MKTIHKYRLPIQAYSAIEMPAIARIIHIGTQNKDEYDEYNVYLWAEVETNFQRMTTRYFRFVATGQEMPKPRLNHSLKHLATIVGSQVWHIYEELP